MKNPIVAVPHRERARGVHNIALRQNNNIVLLFIAALTLLAPINAYAQTTGVCGRTAQVRDALVAAADVTACGDVTTTHLSAITSLFLLSKGITSLQNGDFAGLTSLTSLYLGDNSLTGLPSDVFADLTSLTSLYLSDNSLTGLPSDVFADLTSLTELILGYNSLNNLPASVFSDLTSLTELDLSDNSLTGLPTGIFSGLTSLTTLTLRNNALTSLSANVFSDLTGLTYLKLDGTSLTSLPAGIFSGLTSLTTLELNNNQITVSLERVGTDQFKAVIATGAPFAMTLPITVSSNGLLPAGTTSLSISAGSVESQAITVTHATSYTEAVTADIGTLPQRPSGHRKYTLAKSADLPIVVLDSPGVCGRTAQVRDGLVAAVANVTACKDVTATHLSAITSLNLARKSITSLHEDDFAGLTGLHSLYLNNNSLSSLPVDIFSSLTSLRWIDLSNNSLSSLPANVFSGLSLVFLKLSGNQFDGPPNGIFVGMTSLVTLHLDAPALPVALERVDEGRFKATMATGAPFQIIVAIHATEGGKSLAKFNVAIPQGSVESEPVSIQRSATAAVSVDIDNFVDLDDPFSVYSLSKAPGLPLQIFDAVVEVAVEASGYQPVGWTGDPVVWSGNDAVFTVKRCDPVTDASRCAAGVTSALPVSVQVSGEARTVTIPANEYSVEVQVPTSSQGNPSINLVSGDGYVIDSRRAGARMVVHDAPASTFFIAESPESVVEGTAIDFTVQRCRYVESVCFDEDLPAQTINQSVTRQGNFFSGTPPTTLAFAEGVASTALTVSTLDDVVDEDDGSVTVAIAASDGATGPYEVGSPGSATVEITDNDASFVLDVADVTASEADGFIEFAVTLKKPEGTNDTERKITVDYVTASGTATEGEDYLAASGTLTLDRAQLSRTVRVTLVTDNQKEPQETFTLTLRNAVNATLEGGGVTLAATGTIEANEAPATLPVTMTAPDHVVEGESAVFTLTREGDATARLEVEVEVRRLRGGFPTGDAVPHRVTFQGGQTTATLTVASVEDNDSLDPDRTLTARMTHEADNVQRVPIHDNDPPEISIEATGYMPTSWTGVPVIWEGDEAVFILKRCDPATNRCEGFWTPEELTVNVSIAGYSDRMVAFSRGVFTTELRVPTSDAGSLGLQGNVSPQLQSGDGYIPAAGDAGTATVAVYDVHPQTVRITSRGNSALYPEGSYVRIFIGRCRSINSVCFNEDLPEQIVNLSVTEEGSFISGTPPTTVAFAENVLEAHLDVQTLDDAITEDDGSITVTIAASDGTTGPYEISSPNSITHNIIDNDDQPRIGIENATGGESDGTITFSVTLNIPDGTDYTDQTVTVDYTTASGTATEGTDYTAASSSLTFAPQETEKTISVTLTDDDVSEQDETFTVTLSNAQNAGLDGGGTTLSATGTIVDDDLAHVSIAADADAVIEGQAAAFTLTRSGSLTNAVTVNVAVTTESDPHGDLLLGTAPTTATFQAGQNTAPLNVFTSNNSRVEYNRAVKVAIEPGGVTDYTIVADASEARVTVRDNEKPHLTLTNYTFLGGRPHQLNEGDLVKLHLKRVGDITVPLNVPLQWGIRVGQAWNTHFSTPRPQTATFPAGKSSVTVTVPTDDDNLDEPDTNISGGPVNPVINPALNLAYTADSRKVIAQFLIRDDDGPQITIAAVTTPVTESADAVFTLTRSAGQGRMPVQVTLTQDGDFLAASPPTGVTFAAGNLTTTLTVSLDDDDLEEEDGSVTATLVEDGAYEIGDPSSATVAITDDDDPQIVRIAATSTASVVEGNDAVFTLTRRSLVSGQEVANTRGELTVNVTVSQQGNFFTANPPTRVVFPSGDNEVTLRVPTVKDYVADGTGAVIVTLAEGVGYDIPPAGQSGRKATVTVTDDNQGQEVRIAAAQASVAEGQPVVFNLTRSIFTRTRSLVGELRVRVDLTDPGGILSGAPTTATAVFANGSAQTTLSLPTTDNAYVEDDPRVTATLTERAGYRVPAEGASGRAATVRVNDNDGTVRVSLSRNAAQVTEGQDVVFTLNRSGDPSGRLQVLLVLGGHEKIMTAATRAKRNRRFIASFGASQSSFDLRFTTEADEINEGDGKIWLRIENSPSVSYTVSGARSKAVIVKDDDFPVLTMKESVVDIDEGSPMGWTMVRTGDLTNHLHISWGFSTTRDHYLYRDESIKYVAYNRQPDEQHSVRRFQPGRSELTFLQYPRGDRNFVGPRGGTAIYTILDDGCDETTEFCEKPGYTIGEPRSTTYNIANRFAAVFIRPVSASVNEGDPATFTIERLWNSNNIDKISTNLTIRVTQNGSVISGTSPTTATFTPGQSEITLSIPTQDDDVKEDDGAITVEIVSPGPLNEQSNETAYYPAGTVDGVNYSRATVTVRDDDENPSVTVRALAESVVEGEIIRFAFSRTGATDEALKFKFKENRIYDYFFGFPGRLTPRLTIEAGQSELIRTIYTYDRPDIDLDGAVEVTVLPPEDDFPVHYKVGDPSYARTEIRNNDAARISIAATPERIFESETAVFTLTRTGVTSREHTVLVSIDDPEQLAAVALPTSVSFNVGDIEKTMSFSTISPDPILQGDRTITATVVLDHNFEPPGASIPPNYRFPTYLLGDPSSATLTVADAPLPTLAIADASAGEADGNVTFTVTPAGYRYGAISFDYATSGGTAIEGADYTATSGTLTIATNETQKTIQVPVTNDALAEADETFTLTLSNPQNATFDGTTTLDATGTIEDDEVLRVSIAAAAETVIEGSDARFTLSVSGGTVTDDVEVGYTLSGTATAGTDYTAPDGTFTIAAGQTSGTLAIPIANDSEREFEETLVATVTSASNIAEVRLDATEATVKIRDASSRVFLSLDRAEVAENDDGQIVRVSATLNAALLTTPTTVRVSVSGGTATAADFAAVNSFDITIPANTREGSGSFTLTPVDDDQAEGDETITVSGEVTSQTPARSPPLTVTSADITLTDDEREVIVIPTALTVDEGQSKSYGIWLASQPTEAVTVTVGVPSGTDVSATPTTLIFTASNYQTPQPVVVSAAADADLVSDADVTLTNSVSSAGDYNGVTAPDVVVTTAESGSAVSIAAPAGPIPEPRRGTSDAVFTLTRTGRGTEALTVTVDVSETGFNMRVDESDEGRRKVTFEAGQTTATHAVTIRRLTSIDPNSIITVTVIDGDMYRPAAVGASAQVVVEDIDVRVTVRLATDVLRVQESAGSVPLPIEATTAKNQLPVQAFSISVNTYEQLRRDNEENPAEAQWDYISLSEMVLVPLTGWQEVMVNGETVLRHTVTQNLQIKQDQIVEDEEYLIVQIDRGIGSPAFMRVNDALRVVIEDDDDATFALAVAPGRVEEGEAATVTVSTGGVTFEEDQTISLSLTGTAQAGTDYAVASGGTELAAPYTLTLEGADIRRNPRTNELRTFREGASEVTATINTVEDDVDEGAETVKVTASEGGTAIGTEQTITITDNDERGVTVNPTVLTVTEGLSNTYEVKLNSQPTATVTVAVATTTSSDADVTVSPMSLTFTTGNWSTAQTVTVSAAQDADADNDAATVEHTVTGGDYGANNVKADDVTVTVTDDENASTAVTLSVNPETVAEDVGASGQVITVTAALNAGARTTPTIVTVSVGAGTASTGDFAAVSDFPVTIAAQARSNTGTFTLKPVNDDVDEENETVIVNGIASGLTVTGTTVTITDDDERGVTVNPTSLTVTEGSSETYEVELDSQPTANVTVTVSGASGDVSVSGLPLTFTADTWNTAQTVTVSAAEDADAVVDPSVTLTHAVSGGDYGSVTAADVVVTIAENDTPTLSIADASAGEGDGSMAFTVTLSVASSQTVTVEYATANWTAVAGQDYTAVTRSTLTFAPEGALTQTITVAILDDRADEDDERFTLNLRNPENAVLDPSRAVMGALVAEGKIVDDDVRGLVFDPTELEVQEEGSDETYTVALATPPAIPAPGSSLTGTKVTIDLSVLPATGGEVTVVSPNPARLTFNADNWNTGQTVTVRATHDADAVNDKATLRHTTSGADYAELAFEYPVRVIDDETASTEVTLSVNPEEVAEDVGAAGQAITVTATLNGAPRTTPTTMTISVAAGTASTGDFAAVSDITVEIPAQAMSGTGTFTLTPVDDDVDEENETVIVSGTVTGLTVTGTTVTITDDDEAAFSLSVSDATIDENGGSSTVTLSTGGVSFTSDKTFALTLGGNATKATDYTVGSESLTLTAGQNSVATTVTATDDAVDENNETITVAASLNGNAVGSSQTITITDDDERGVTVNPTSLTVTEGSSKTYEVELTSQPTGNVTVSVSGASGDVSVSGSPLTFTPSTYSTAQTVTVSAAKDADAVADAKVTLTHAVTGGDYGSVTASDVEVTITENDTPTLSIAPASAGEGDGSMAFTVTLSVASSNAVTVTYATSNGTATAGEDYTSDNGTLTFPANSTAPQTISVPITNDKIDEEDETFTVTLSNPRNATLSGGQSTLAVTGTIEDDDTRGVTSVQLL